MPTWELEFFWEMLRESGVVPLTPAEWNAGVAGRAARLAAHTLRTAKLSMWFQEKGLLGRSCLELRDSIFDDEDEILADGGPGLDQRAHSLIGNVAIEHTEDEYWTRQKPCDRHLKTIEELCDRRRITCGTGGGDSLVRPIRRLTSSVPDPYDLACHRLFPVELANRARAVVNRFTSPLTQRYDDALIMLVPGEWIS